MKQSRGKVEIVADRCKECGFCIEFCPRHILVRGAGVNRQGYHPVRLEDAAKCTGCNLCAMVCPDFAIFVTDEET